MMSSTDGQLNNNFMCHQVGGEGSMQIGSNNQDSKFFKGTVGINEKSMTLPQHGATQNCQSLDPFSLRNRLGGSNLDSKKLNNDRRELDSLALSEFKINSGQINQLQKRLAQMTRQDYDQSMTQFLQPTPRPSSGIVANRFKKRNSIGQSDNEHTSFTSFLLQN